MLQITLLVAVIAVMGNAVATPEQRAASRAAVKRLEWIPMLLIGIVIAWCILAEIGAIPTH